MKRITIEKCRCGSEFCRDYWLVGTGKFVQGSGFSREEAELIVELLNKRQEDIGGAALLPT